MGGVQRTTLLQFVSDLVAQAESVLLNLGVDPSKARQAGMEIAFRLCEQYAKTYMYVPTPNSLVQALRNHAIALEYDQDGPGGVARRTRDRIDQIAAIHDITVQQVYNVLSLQESLQAAETKHASGVLPGFERPSVRA
ncbi:MAG: hypothetical protein HS128_19365 [Ideonella sp.]|nr:hypothetical protein [Ideonella sp.]MCC7455949.1 hypothetical protein [Nitrospira sp.]